MDTLGPLPSRRPRAGPGTPLGIDEELIHEVVHAFYARIRKDPALKGIFNRVVADNWDSHLAKMCDFWSSVLLMTGRFKGTPMAAHARIPDIRATHFARWLHLFRETMNSICPGEKAALFIAKAEMIGQSLLYGIAASRGELPSRSDALLQAGPARLEAASK